MAERAVVSAVTIEMGGMEAVKGNDDEDDRPGVSESEDEHEPLVASTSEGRGPVVEDEQRARAPPTVAENALGMALYALGVVCSSITALSARLLHRRFAIDVVWIVLGRASAGLLVVAAALSIHARRGNVAAPFGVRRKALCLRGLVGTCAVFSFFLTAANLPLADAAVPALIAPLVTTLVAARWLGETPHWAVWAAFPVCALGATLVLRPGMLLGDAGDAGDDGDGDALDDGHVIPATSSQNRVTALGVGAAVAQTFFGGFSKVLVRVLSGGIAADGTSRATKEHPLVLILYTNVFSVLGMSALAFGFRVFFFATGAAEEHSTPRVRRDDAEFVTALFVASTFSGFGAQLCITAALGRASASAVMPVHYTGVFWAVLWGWLLLGETPGAAEACGIAVVALGSAAASAANLAEKKKKPDAES